MTDKIMTYFGVDVNELSRDELIDALRVVSSQLNEALSQEVIPARYEGYGK